MKQVISVAPDGTVSGLQHKRGQGLDLRTLGGTARIERASEVLWDDTAQAWFVELRSGAGSYAGRELTDGLMADALGEEWHVNLTHHGIQPGTGLVLFTEYEDGVKAEIAVLNALRQAGKLT